MLSGESAPAAVALRSRDISLHGRSRHRFWTYVPRDTSAASDEHPICQTYVDTCLLGCLERGGAGSLEVERGVFFTIAGEIIAYITLFLGELINDYIT